MLWLAGSLARWLTLSLVAVSCRPPSSGRFDLNFLAAFLQERGLALRRRQQRLSETRKKLFLAPPHPTRPQLHGRHTGTGTGRGSGTGTESIHIHIHIHLQNQNHKPPTQTETRQNQFSTGPFRIRRCCVRPGVCD